jgi:cytochrome b561
MSQVYTLFTVLKCNLVFVFRCFFHYHFHATCFSNSLPSSGVVPLTISLQFIVRIDVKLKYPVHGLILTSGNPQNLYKLLYTHLFLLYFIFYIPVHGIILTLGNPKNLYKLLYTHFILLYFIFYTPVHGIILTLGNPKNLYKLLYTHFILL